MDIVDLVKIALDPEELREKTLGLMQEAASFFESGNIEKGIVMLYRLSSLTDSLCKANITEEFKDFLTDDGLWDWIQSVATGKINAFDNMTAIEMVMTEVLLLVNEQKLFQDQEIEVEEGKYASSN
jgi:hypothetical protein